MITQHTGRRFEFVDVAYTPAERLDLWCKRLLAAWNWQTPRTHTEMRELAPGTPEYDASFLEETLVWTTPTAPVQHITPIPTALTAAASGPDTL